MAELEAIPAQRPRARSPGARGKLREQTRLADARVARDERQPGPAIGGVSERDLELGELE